MGDMMMAYPFRLGADGTIVKIEGGTEDYYAQELAVMVMTEPGERHLAPEFGVPDIAFDELDQVELSAAVEEFGPPVVITSVTGVPVGADKADITVTFDLLDVEQVDDEDFGFDDDSDETDEDEYIEEDDQIDEATD